MITDEQYLALCEQVRQQALQIAELCSTAERNANLVAMVDIKKAGLAALELGGQMLKRRAELEMVKEMACIDSQDPDTLAAPNGGNEPDQHKTSES